jgi:hypothetical protein
VSRSLEQALADWRGDAAVLRRQGHIAQADLIDRLCSDVLQAAEDYLTWVSEDDAMIRTGHSKAWLRSRFPGWVEQGIAKQEGPRRLYRLLALPRRANLDAAREAARREARRVA